MNAYVKDIVKHLKVDLEARVSAFQARNVDALQRLEETEAAVTVPVKRHLAQMDANLLRLLLSYYASVEAEDNLGTELKQWSQLRHEQLIAACKQSSQLTLLAQHVARETNGQVRLIQLAHTSPEFLRCKQAVMDCVRSGFYSSSAAESLEVQDVRQIDNRWLSKPFVAASKERPASHIKGLFCTLPSESLVHTILFGGGRGAAEDYLDMFGSTWQQESRNGDAPDDHDKYYVQGRARSSRHLPEKHPFSR
ncbi:hypothetical protein CYMTET_9071, partial [Cymbomonas tetramitiformis]